MARHFLQLYLLIVATLAVASWGQERLWELYSSHDAAAATAEPAQAAALNIIATQLLALPPQQREPFVARLAAETGLDFELFEAHDIAGRETLLELDRGDPAFLGATDGKTWMLKRLPDDGRVLAFRYASPDMQRGPFDRAVALLFYAAIALVIMAWLWPLRRDLRRLERSTMNFGKGNWKFDADIKPHSQVYPLARAFRRMAARIDHLIGSHRDMSNAIAHEIKTPLARMRFEIEMARSAQSQAPGQVQDQLPREQHSERLAEHLRNIQTDIAELNAFVTATLDYAILERAEVALNIGTHDFTNLIPAVADSVRRGTGTGLAIQVSVPDTATGVRCDAHLMETVIRNLLYNAVRHAHTIIRVTFVIRPEIEYRLEVDDDGPGIAAQDCERVFASFVQLAPGAATGKTGYGLGLAIVKRIVEWHGGEVTASRSTLGGASFHVRWPLPAAP